ncbi:MAG: hypothetical protein LBL62_04510 [Planctomycetaceae bacterium]|jgi:PBP1b-binding outer membrane lipoprotein LpoB|nr:hypothetical protein [Planctomycetaceae bacterium]
MRNFKIHILLLTILILSGCSDCREKTVPEHPVTISQQDNVQQQDNIVPPLDAVVVTDIVRKIESVFGEVERAANGTIINVDLAKGRSSVSDEVLQDSLRLPGLKKLRVAGAAVTSETLRQIAKQTNLEKLYLQDTPICDEDLAVLLPALSQLQNLTLRGCNNVTDKGLKPVLALPKLRALALIRMNLTRQGLEKVVVSKKITALDLRQCSELKTEDYLLLLQMSSLSDLKIAGFSIDDSVLETVAQLPKLTGLTLEDTIISPEGFAKMTAQQNITENLTSLILARNSMLFDAGLEPLKNLRHLKRLSVNTMMVTGEFLNTLASEESKRPKLENLSLEKSLLNPEGAAALKHFRELKSLNLTGVALSQELADIITALETPETINLSDCQLDNEMLKNFRAMKSVKTLIL